MESFEVASEREWTEAWAWLSPKLGSKKILALEGDLGAGKTTFIKSIANQLGSTDEVTSPTFSIVQEYLTPQGSIFHFDLYRLNSIEEFFDLDFDNYLEGARLVVVEWPQIAQGYLDSEGACFIRIEHITTGGRLLLTL